MQELEMKQTETAEQESASADHSTQKMLAEIALEKIPAKKSPELKSPELKSQELNSPAEHKSQRNAINDPISPEGVAQGNIGDCFFEAALASLANSKQGAETIRNMIKANEDGSYTVTFPGDKKSPVDLNKEDLDLTSKNGKVADRADWARIIETAFFKYNHIPPYDKGLNNKILFAGVPALGNVITPEKALRLLTGKSTSTDSMAAISIDNRSLTVGRTSKENIARNIENALSRGEPVTAWAVDGILGKLMGNKNSFPMVGQHVYSVLDYDPQSREITVRNPWGKNEGTALAGKGRSVDGITNTGDGRLKMSLDTFYKEFSDVNYAGSDSRKHNFQNTISDLAQGAENLNKLGKDVLSGRFTELGKDIKDLAASHNQIQQDIIYGLSDTASRAVKTSLSNEVNLVTGTYHKLENVAKTVLNSINLFK